MIRPWNWIKWKVKIDNSLALSPPRTLNSKLTVVANTHFSEKAVTIFKRNRAEFSGLYFGVEIIPTERGSIYLEQQQACFKDRLRINHGMETGQLIYRGQLKLLFFYLAPFFKFNFSLFWGRSSKQFFSPTNWRLRFYSSHNVPKEHNPQRGQTCTVESIRSWTFWGEREGEEVVLLN